MKLLTSNKRELNLDLSDPKVKAWFDRSDETMTKIILNQINNDCIYDNMLADANEDYVILDIGANIGLFSLYAQDSAQHIYCLEPAPDTLEILQKLTKGNDKITIVPAALSNLNGQTNFYLHSNPTINSVNVNQNGTLVLVKTITIGNLLEQYKIAHVDFVKCDIEGGEMSALTVERLDEVKDKIDKWFIEIHQTNRDQSSWPGNLQENRRQIIQNFKTVGYKTIELAHDGLFAYKE